jgi:hypothetical protein
MTKAETRWLLYKYCSSCVPLIINKRWIKLRDWRGFKWISKLKLTQQTRLLLQMRWHCNHSFDTANTVQTWFSKVSHYCKTFSYCELSHEYVTHMMMVCPPLRWRLCRCRCRCRCPLCRICEYRPALELHVGPHIGQLRDENLIDGIWRSFATFSFILDEDDSSVFKPFKCLMTASSVATYLGRQWEPHWRKAIFGNLVSDILTKWPLSMQRKWPDQQNWYLIN